MPCLQTNVIPIVEPVRPSPLPTNRINWPLILLLVVVEAVIILWNLLDHSTPCWDTANHRLNSLAMYNLLKHTHARSICWYRSLFTISPLYPPLFYLISASLKVICGELAETELFSNLLFVAVMYFSTYYIARQMSNNKLTALLAPVLVFLYPFIFWSTHCALLDCATNAMVALGLGIFIWWAKSPSLVRSLVLGITFGLVALTKHNAVAFLIGPALVDGVLALIQRNKARIKYLFFTCILSTLTILPWIVFAGASVSKFVASIQDQPLDFNDLHNPIGAFLTNFICFSTVDLPMILTPLLCWCFLIALIGQRNFNNVKLYLNAQIFVGILLISTFRWQHQCRYITPVASAIAIITAEMFAQAWYTKRMWLRTVITTVATLALIQFTYVAFMPYPVPCSGWLNKLMQCLRVQNAIDRLNPNPQGISLHPLPEADWGSSWALSKIEKQIGLIPVSVNVMPNSDSINVSSYIYLTRLHQLRIYPFDGRQYTVIGDRVTFNQKLALLFDWYILTTGNQGRQLADLSSYNDYLRWSDFVRFSHQYKLEGMKKLPDDSFLELYKRAH